MLLFSMLSSPPTSPPNASRPRPSCSSATYDANGNSLNDTFRSATWDADSNPISIGPVTLTYDAFDSMVEQSVSGTNSEIVYSPTGVKLALMRGTTLTKAFIPLPGGATAVYTSSGLAYYRHPDAIGSVRLATTPGRTVYFDTGYAPFGETYASSGGSNLDPAYTGQMGDTAHREDVVGGQYALYDFPAREYSVQGRWPNPDPAGLQATCPKNPQSQNRYAYVLGNPITRVDPTGMYTLDCNNGENPFCGYCDAFPDDPACQNPCGFDFFDDPFCPFGGGGGSGGGGRGFVGGGSPTPQLLPPFPWAQLPVGLFGPLTEDRRTKCYKDFLNCANFVDRSVDDAIKGFKHDLKDCATSCVVGAFLGPEGYFTCLGMCAATFDIEMWGANMAREVGYGICNTKFSACIKGVQ